MGTDNTYNGWTNRETWLVNLWLGDEFAMLQEDGEEITADYIESVVDEMVENAGLNGLLSDLLSISGINYDEIASHYALETEEE